jgi:YHS domain-containing protein
MIPEKCTEPAPRALRGARLSLTAALLVFAASCARNEQPAEAQPTPVAEPARAARTAASEGDSVSRSAGALTLVSDRSLVCMVNNQYMGKPQIPVSVDGKTYYGCCEMCKGRLAKDATARMAVDPVSNKPVDKATAVIAKNAAGSALYFENERNFAAYKGEALQ